MRTKTRKYVVLLTISIISIFVLSTLSSSAFGTIRVTYTGTVKDNNGSPLSGAYVRLYSSSTIKTVTTNSNGYYSLTADIFEFGLYMLDASKSGYITKTRPAPNRNAIVNFVLQSAFPIVYTYSGYVYDNYDSSPVQGATVRLKKNTGSGWLVIQSRTTNSNGYYLFAADSTSSYPQYQIVVSGELESQTKSHSPTISGSKTHTFNVDVHRKYAVVVAINEYFYHDDLNGGYENANGWYDLFINTLDFHEVWVYGDDNSYEYDKYDGKATGGNVEDALEDMAALADNNDRIVFTFKGHGSNGKLYCNGVNNLKDNEVSDALEDSLASRIFVFLHACSSGSFSTELMGMTNSDNVFLTTSTTATGTSYSCDDGGYWFHNFHAKMLANPTTCLETIYSYAYNSGYHTFPAGTMDPQKYDGDLSTYFYLR